MIYYWVEITFFNKETGEELGLTLKDIYADNNEQLHAKVEQHISACYIGVKATYKVLEKKLRAE
ncbi:hypothetical protein C6371_03575 [Bacillus atrophaeus]|uniref:hypothetical protein n=1 Tax=Bacillus atrophaeus TaxID=1452 RepID=UPI000D05A502|nr:hypothetical protein [Bacillus atrophaeus]PSA94142.1 hypothetical protein C6371_03575 [Bacillus atrophaeus]